VATILLCGVDLFFRGKLEALLPEHHFITVDHTDAPDLVIADISRIDAGRSAETYRTQGSPRASARRGPCSPAATAG